MALTAHRPDPVLRSAPTGVASFMIRGYTLHSLFLLLVRQAFAPLSKSGDEMLRFNLTPAPGLSSIRSLY